MATTWKTRLLLAGLLAGSLALGTGCKRAEAEAAPQDLLEQQEQRGQQGDDTGAGDEGTAPEQDQGGTGGAGDAGTGSLRQFEGTFEEPATGGAGNDDTVDEGTLEEPGTGGAGDTWNEGRRDEDEGVLQPGVNDEGLDNQDPMPEPDTDTQDAR
ncbi:hypothetical protein [Archangium sp.]|uniref:hypothetical protein n=1 Tax=Archangium sp. TaxID=1872627 RepID=UPI00286C94BE|nr:hypothetical protein [Archangium sp.]